MIRKYNVWKKTEKYERVVFDISGDTKEECDDNAVKVFEETDVFEDNPKEVYENFNTFYLDDEEGNNLMTL